jgi:hypothetical protein
MTWLLMLAPAIVHSTDVVPPLCNKPLTWSSSYGRCVRRTYGDSEPEYWEPDLMKELLDRAVIMQPRHEIQYERRCTRTRCR